MRRALTLTPSPCTASTPLLATSPVPRPSFLHATSLCCSPILLLLLNPPFPGLPAGAAHMSTTSASSTCRPIAWRASASEPGSACMHGCRRAWGKEPSVSSRLRASNKGFEILYLGLASALYSNHVVRPIIAGQCDSALRGLTPNTHLFTPSLGCLSLFLHRRLSRPPRASPAPPPHPPPPTPPPPHPPPHPPTPPHPHPRPLQQEPTRAAGAAQHTHVWNAPPQC